MNEEQNKKVFISYSWTTPSHERWVLDLAERLVNNGVEVILDKWDLAEGQDKYVFMEKMVQDETIDKVLIVCDKGYKEKANDRKGGVGTETQIISPTLYCKTEETKFIPIIAQSGDVEFEEYIPNYLKGRIGIAMNNEESYMKGFEQLLRAIYEKPMFKKPKLGKMPSFLKSESKITSELYFINKTLKKYIDDDRNGMIEYTINDFKERFFEELNNFIINSDDLKEPYDEQIIDSIDNMKEIRDEYLYFIENLICGYNNFKSDLIIEFFEEMYSYSEYKGEGSSHRTFSTEHFNFFIMELFIWTNVLLFKYKKYKIIEEIIYNRYFVKSKYKNEPKSFWSFRFYLSIINEYRNKRLGLNRRSITADKLIERAEYNGKNYRGNIIDVDLILYYISVSSKSFEYEWYPTTCIYKDYYSKIEFISKMARRQHFEDIKGLFDVKNVEEMKNILTMQNGYSNSLHSIPRMTSSISVDEIAKY